MKLIAVINRKAGTAINWTDAALEKEVRDVFERANYDVSVILANPDEIVASLNRAIGARPDVLLVGGGDGTVRCAAERIVGTDMALGILPLGTLNRLARDLQIPLTLHEALQAVASGQRQAIDVAKVNDKIFLCNSLLGLPPKISAERQKLRGEPLGTRTVGYFRLLRQIIRARRKMRVTVDGGAGLREMRVLSMAVSNNPYSEAPSLVLNRPRLDTGVLGLYISRHAGGLQLMWTLVRAAMGRWKGDPDLDRLTARHIEIATKHRHHVRLSNDGEVDEVETPLRYAILPRALNVLAPVQP